MKRIKQLLIPFLCAQLLACTQPATLYTGEYPDDVRAILENKCATAGCHNEQSFTNAAGLQLDRWGHIWKGSGTGSVIIPYDVKNSSLLYFINSDSSKGPIILPQMPLNNPGLSAAEYETIRSWIAAGAPDKTGVIPFSSSASTRQKIYITQQGCDLIAVVDATTHQVMRMISIGEEAKIEIPHCVRFTEDGKYAYVSFSNGDYVQQIDAETDKVVGKIYLGGGSWNVFHLSKDGKKMIISDYANPGKIKYVDLETKKVLITFEDFQTPHGIASNEACDTLYVTAQFGNTVYKMNLKGWVKQVSMDDKDPAFLTNGYNPHEIMMSPDGSKYFLTCQNSNEIRVMDAHSDKLLKVIPVGNFPQEMSLSRKRPYLFVTCEEEKTPEFPNFVGCVYVIDYNTLELVKRIPGPFYQIHGISVDDQNEKFFVASRNVSSTGPAPHHTSECGGRNGYFNVYDLNTLAPVGNNVRYESTVDPYSSDTRFKNY